jgi:gamma-glutamyltranspeptidase / glutathione hydrolase
MVVGSPGGSTIITSVFQTILNVTEHDQSMQGAVKAGRFHHQWKPKWMIAEWRSFNFWTYAGLLVKGHKVLPVRNIGRVDAILVLPGGKLEGGADPRGDDAADGF